MSLPGSALLSASGAKKKDKSICYYYSIKRRFFNQSKH